MIHSRALDTLLLLTCALSMSTACESKQTPTPPVTQAPMTSNTTSSVPATDATKTTPTKATTPVVADKKDEVTKEPAPVELGPGTSAQQNLLTKAKSAMMNKQSARAEELFEKLAKTQPVSGPQVSAAIALGDMYASSGRHSAAIAIYDALEQDVPGLAEIAMMKGRALVAMQKPDEAIASYERALKRQPMFLFLWVEIGQLHQQQGRDDKAKDSLHTYEKKLYTAASQLEDASGQTSFEDRINILDAFSLIEDDKVTQTLVNVLHKDPDYRMRRQAAEALGAVSAVSARAVLQRAAQQDASDEVRVSAKQALMLMQHIPEPAVNDVISPTRVDSPDDLPK